MTGPTELDTARHESVRLAMVTCIRDEAEMIGANLHYHHAIGVSKAYVFLDSCRDGSVDIVRSMKWAEAIFVDPALSRRARYIASLQRFCMDEALRRARQDGYEWLLMVDPDEFAFADNQIVPGPDDPVDKSWLLRADLRRMLVDVAPDTTMVTLRTLEVVPTHMKAGAPFWRQKYFQDRHALEREIVDPRSGERWIRQKFFGHRRGKAIVRTEADVQAFDPHGWVQNQQLGFPRQPAYLPAKTESRGCHYHFLFCNSQQFRDKYKKHCRDPEVWRSGSPVGLPKQLWKELSLCLTDSQVSQYLDRYVFLAEDELDRYVRQRLIVKDDTVERVLAESGYFSGSQRFADLKQPRWQVFINSLSAKLAKHRLLEPCEDIPLLAPQCPPYEASDWLEGSYDGVYSLEILEGRYFRWVSPKADVWLYIKQGDYDLTIDLGPLHALCAREALEFAFNGNLVSREQVKIQDSTITIPIIKGQFVPGRHQRLTMLAPPIDTSSWELPETRRLGLPVFAIGISAAP